MVSKGMRLSTKGKAMAMLSICPEHGPANTLDNAVEHQIPAVELGLR